MTQAFVEALAKFEIKVREHVHALLQEGPGTPAYREMEKARQDLIVMFENERKRP